MADPSACPGWVPAGSSTQQGMVSVADTKRNNMVQGTGEYGV